MWHARRSRRGRARGLGHAVQYARHYAPIYIRAAIVPVTNIGSRLSMPLIVLGLVLSGLGQIFLLLCGAGGRGLLRPLRRVPASLPCRRSSTPATAPLHAIDESALSAAGGADRGKACAHSCGS